MPTYSMKNTETEEVFEIAMPMADREQYLKDNPHIKQIFTRFPAIGDSVRLGIRKPDNAFRDVLSKAKSAHHGSNIDTR